MTEWLNWTELNSSVQLSHSVVSDSLRPHESQHARPACPSPTPGVHSNLCPWSRWCHAAISSSVVPFSCPQSLPASGSFPMSQLFAWSGQSIGVSVLFNIKKYAVNVFKFPGSKQIRNAAISFSFLSFFFFFFFLTFLKLFFYIQRASTVSA